jgi:hypothetical protein
MAGPGGIEIGLVFDRIAIEELVKGVVHTTTARIAAALPREYIEGVKDDTITISPAGMAA